MLCCTNGAFQRCWPPSRPKRLYVAVDDNEAKARAKLSEALSYQYGARDYQSMGVAGAPGRIVDRIGREDDLRYSLPACHSRRAHDDCP
jgi:hypothetical protein